MLTLALLCLTACQKESKTSDRPENASEKPDFTPIWEYDYNTDLAVRKRMPATEDLSAVNLITLLNHTNTNVSLSFVKVSSDTIFVRVDDATVLTQQMGSAGAAEFMAIATYTLTELPGIAKVHFEFEPGDHASPGTYDRDFFEQAARNIR